MSPKVQLAILLAACALVAAAGAVPFQNPLASESARLMKLVDDVNDYKPVTAEQVFAAYREYANLYALQEKLAGAKSPELSDKYEAVSKVLGQFGVDDVADTLFAPFKGRSPDADMSSRERAKVLKAIKGM